MTYRIRPKRSSVAGLVPAPTDLAVGEMAINLADGKIYAKNASNVVVQISTGNTSSIESNIANLQTEYNSLSTVAHTGAYADLTGKPTLANVATTGSYTDLTNKPTIPTATSQLTNDSGFVTNASLTWSNVSGKPTFATVATTGSYGDLSGVPTTVSHFTNDAGYITNASLTWGNVTGKPTFANVATSGAYSDLTGTPTLATVATTGAYSDLTGKPTLATVATSGSYTDLTNQPSIPSGSVALTGDVTGSGTTGTPFATTLANSGVTAGSYGSSTLVPVITVDEKGRITTATTVAVSGGGGGGTPGGSTTQIQYNDAGSFAGSANLVYDNTSGTITLGNTLQVTGNTAYGDTRITTVGNIATGSPTAGRIAIGTGFAGDWSNTSDWSGDIRGARVAVYDAQSKSDDGVRTNGIAVNKIVNLPANVSLANGASRIQGIQSDVMITGPGYWGTGTTNGVPALRAMGAFTVIGNVNASIGSPTTAMGACGVYSTLSVTNNSYLVSGATYVSGFATGGGGGTTPQLDHAVGYMIAPNFGGNLTSGYYGVYMPTTTSTINSMTASNATRKAPNYYFLYNDDNVAQNKLGSLKNYHEYRNTVTSSAGAITINKNNGQVQYIDLTESITSVTFSNFVASASDSVNTDYQTDTVTLIINQGATGGYAVTLPTTNCKYAGGNKDVGTTANAVTMVTISAVSIGGTVTYLISVSPEFV